MRTLAGATRLLSPKRVISALPPADDRAFDRAQQRHGLVVIRLRLGHARFKNQTVYRSGPLHTVEQFPGARNVALDQSRIDNAFPASVFRVLSSGHSRRLSPPGHANYRFDKGTPSQHYPGILRVVLQINDQFIVSGGILAAFAQRIRLINHRALAQTA